MSTESSTATPAAGTGEVNRLKANSVGLVGVVFMAIATAAPITAMTGNLPMIAGSGGNGLGAPAAYIVATVVLTIFSVGYVTMAKHITAAGAFYGFISHGLGRVAGMASGMLAVLAYVVFEGSILGFFAFKLNELVNTQFHHDIHWAWFAFLGVAVIGILGYFDIHLTAKVLGVALVLEITVLAAVSLAVAFTGGGPDGYMASESLNPLHGIQGADGKIGGAAGLGLFFAFWSWVGFESTAMYGEESRDPKKVVPRATLISVIGVGLFYIFVSWMMVSAEGKHVLEDQSGLFFNPLGDHYGSWAVKVFQWLVVTGSFACAMAFHQCASRYLYAIGREGFIHPALGKTHPKQGSPYVASAVQSIITVVLIVLFLIADKDPYVDLYGLLALLGTMAILIVQTLCSFAAVGYFHVQGKHPETKHWFKTMVAPIVSGVAMAGVVGLLVYNMDTAAGAAKDSLVFEAIPYIVGAFFLAGIGIALYMKNNRPEAYERMGRIILEDAGERDGATVPAQPAGEADPVRA
ncbi:APC family permease [Yinghuangia seranimata]|uniref:APC family permease n=1 Tax=Yinghuangia seranimata TaxID=408067 RepID=UPI00248B9F06|nr:APC family permease [Yinghuangia seranimata]MDI2132815.1 APC family permease [Yinghuangia seranimata]